MENIDIQSKSFVLRWIRVKRGDVINYQVKPLKKSIGFGIYKRLKNPLTLPSISNSRDSLRHNGGSFSSLQSAEGPQVHIQPDNTNLMAEFRTRTLSLSSSSILKEETEELGSSLPSAELLTRLDQSGLIRVQWVGVLNSNELNQGTLTVDDFSDELYYAFILDNTTSKTTKKKVLFNASVVHPTCAYDNESIVSQEEMTQEYNFNNTLNTNSVCGTPKINAASQREVFMVKQGRILQGYLLKKRRKRLQGFSKRFFKLDFKYGMLSYYLNERTSVCRGEVVVNLSTVSANRKTRLIVIDSGVEIWALKARNDQEWATWVEALESCFKKRETRQGAKVVSQKLSLQANAHSLMSDIRMAQNKIEECKMHSAGHQQVLERFLLKPQTPQTVSESGSSSVASSKGPFLRSRNATVADSPSYPLELRVAPPASVNPNVITSESIVQSSLLDQGHEQLMYRKLCELEGIIASISSQSQILFTSPLFKSFAEGGIADTSATAATKSSTASVFSEEFFDALDDVDAVIMLDDDEGVDSGEPKLDTEYLDETSGVPEDDGSDLVQDKQSTYPSKQSVAGDVDLYPLPINTVINRRDDVRMPTTSPPSLLSFFRKNVGKDLNSISMPITSNEPITVLQLMAENFEYSELLTKAANIDDPVSRMAHVATFAVSYLSTYRVKARAMRKPLNPLLGETYELVREDKGFRLLGEKVSHKPQVFAFHVEHTEWECSYTSSPVQKFWGKSLEFTNEGAITLLIKRTGEVYRWSQPTMILKNIIAGERYVEPMNQFEVSCANGCKATISFKRSGMFSGRSEDITISVYEHKRSLAQVLKGQWTSGLTDTNTGEIIWEVGELVNDAQKKYGFTKFAANLNAITALEDGHLPPTDSRLRPDLRLYESGAVEEAEELKLKLERMQRQRRHEGADIKPKYFKKYKNEWQYISSGSGYWEKRKQHDWSDSPTLW